MGLQITRREIDRAMSAAHSAHSRLSRHQGRIENATAHTIQTVTVAAGAMAAGVVKGRFGAVSLGPVPADLLAAVGLHVLAYMGLAGKYSDNLHDIGDGVLASYVNTLGAGLGSQWRVKAGLSPFAGEISGYSQRRHGLSSGAGPLSAQELAAMASAVRG